MVSEVKTCPKCGGELKFTGKSLVDDHFIASHPKYADMKNGWAAEYDCLDCRAWYYKRELD